jgi:hypothetical protein
MGHSKRREYDPDKKEWTVVCQCRTKDCAQ